MRTQRIQKNNNVCESIVRKDAEGIKNTNDDPISVKVSANIKLLSERESLKAVADKLGYENCSKIAMPKAEEKTKVVKSSVKVRSAKKHGKKARTKAKRIRSVVKRKRLMLRKSHLRRKCFVKNRAVKRKLSRRKKTIVARRNKRKVSLLILSKKKRRVSFGKASTIRKRQKSSMQSSKPFILRTGCSNRSEDKALKKIGATILADIDPKVTHICMDKFRTTKKVLCGLAFCKYIVSNKWLSSCVENGSFDIDETRYKIKVDPTLRKLQRQLDFKFPDVIMKRDRKYNKIFYGLKLFVTRKVDPAFCMMFIAHGGKLSATPGRKFNPKIIVIGLDESDEEAQQLIKRKFKVRNTCWVKASIFRQKLPKASEFKVKAKF